MIKKNIAGISYIIIIIITVFIIFPIDALNHIETEESISRLNAEVTDVNIYWKNPQDPLKIDYSIFVENPSDLHTLYISRVFFRGTWLNNEFLELQRADSVVDFSIKPESSIKFTISILIINLDDQEKILNQELTNPENWNWTIVNRFRFSIGIQENFEAYRTSEVVGTTFSGVFK